MVHRHIVNRHEREAAALAAYQDIYTRLASGDLESVLARMPDSVPERPAHLREMRWWIQEKSLSPASVVAVRVEGSRAEIQFPADPDGVGWALTLESGHAGWWPHSVGLWATKEHMDLID